jgi:predicted metal-dependent phosphoesterase TrpH
MVRAGHVPSVQAAFDAWLATGRPGFIERTGPSPAAIVDAIHGAGGIASLAHPAVTRRDELIAPLVGHGLDAIEVYHSDHTAEAQQKYLEMARTLGVLISGGSDFHGEETRRNLFGVVTLPADAFAALESRSLSIRLKPDSTR